MTETPRADALLIELISSPGEPSFEGFAILTDEHEREKALHVLLALLTDPSEILCRRAVQALGSLGDKRAVDGLINSLDDLDELASDLFLATFSTLVNLGDSQAIIPLLAHRITAIRPEWLMTFDKESLLRVLSDAVYHPDDNVRERVFTILGYIDDPRSIGLLINALNDEDDNTRVDSVRALIRLRAAEAAPFLRPHLSDPYVMMRQWTTMALGQFGDRDAVPALRPLLEDEYPPVRMRAAFALTALGDPQGAETTRTLVTSGSLEYTLLSEAVNALRAIQDPVVPLLITVAKRLLNGAITEAWKLRPIAVILGEQGDPAALALLNEMSVHIDGRLRSTAQQAIDAITARMEDCND